MYRLSLQEPQSHRTGMRLVTIRGPGGKAERPFMRGRRRVFLHLSLGNQYLDYEPLVATKSCVSLLHVTSSLQTLLSFVRPF